MASKEGARVYPPPLLLKEENFASPLEYGHYLMMRMIKDLEKKVVLNAFFYKYASHFRGAQVKLECREKWSY